MKIKITKNINVHVAMDSKDMGKAFAVAAQDEQISFIEAVVHEFNSWDKLDKDTQIARIIDEIKGSEHKDEIVDFFNRVIDFYSY